jgi:DNA-binding response OmpR family regulator
VLLVGDDADLLGLVGPLLGDDGWTVVVVADLVAALGRHGEPFDVVVSDLALREGLSLVRALRSDPDTVRVPVLLLTAPSGSGSAIEALTAGADDYVVKPFDVIELLTRVRAHVELARLRAVALDHAERRVASLEAALVSNRKIGTAIGILMVLFTITENEAFTQLRESSQRLNRKLRDIADEVVLTGALPGQP